MGFTLYRSNQDYWIRPMTMEDKSPSTQCISLNFSFDDDVDVIISGFLPRSDTTTTTVATRIISGFLLRSEQQQQQQQHVLFLVSFSAPTQQQQQQHVSLPASFSAPNSNSNSNSNNNNTYHFRLPSPLRHNSTSTIRRYISLSINTI